MIKQYHPGFGMLCKVPVVPAVCGLEPSHNVGWYSMVGSVTEGLADHECKGCHLLCARMVTVETLKIGSSGLGMAPAQTMHTAKSL